MALPEGDREEVAALARGVVMEFFQELRSNAASYMHYGEYEYPDVETAVDNVISAMERKYPELTERKDDR